MIHGELSQFLFHARRSFRPSDFVLQSERSLSPLAPLTSLLDGRQPLKRLPSLSFCSGAGALAPLLPLYGLIMGLSRTFVNFRLAKLTA